MTKQRTPEEMAKRERVICGYLKLLAVLVAHPEAELPFCQDGGAATSIYTTTQQEWDDTVKAFGIEGAPVEDDRGHPIHWPIEGLNLCICGLHTELHPQATPEAVVVVDDFPL